MAVIWPVAMLVRNVISAPSSRWITDNSRDSADSAIGQLVIGTIRSLRSSR